MAVQVKESLLELVGETPLLRLRRLAASVAPQVLAKVEYLNPGGSVKDRIALAMVEDAEARGLLQPSGTIVEPTSGNTGVGLALVANARGYRCVFAVPDKVSAEKIAVLRAYGAEVVVCPTAVPPEHPNSNHLVAKRLAREIPGAWHPDQYANPLNQQAHYRTTGPEVWSQTDGRVTHFVAGIGTGGTISGAGRYLKEVSGGRVQVIGADPEGSVYSGGSGRPYLLEGVGQDFWPTTYDCTVADQILAVSDRDSFLTTRRLAREEALLVGGSGGLAVAAALRLACKLTADDVVVLVLPDSGRGYLSKIYNDEWMADYGFLVRDASQPTVGDVLHRKSGELPELLHVHPEETIGSAISVLRGYAVSQMPVVQHEPPVMAAEVVGSVIERELLDAVFADRSALHRPLSERMSTPLPMVGAGEPLPVAIDALKKASALLVLDGGKPVGILTRSDLLSFLASA